MHTWHKSLFSANRKVTLSSNISAWLIARSWLITAAMALCSMRRNGLGVLLQWSLVLKEFADFNACNTCKILCTCSGVNETVTIKYIIKLKTYSYYLSCMFKYIYIYSYCMFILIKKKIMSLLNSRKSHMLNLQFSFHYVVPAIVREVNIHYVH